ncbi:PQQ-binding-like beta-propeller repeat protein [Streptomyces gamaensis]|uniref:PQQ-binding-like beta-propeller repeat protein n=1 Tax=Streptomyces gamaensis TaxID=1763542 RepID=A0ABW0Z839_9ACTN
MVQPPPPPPMPSDKPAQGGPGAPQESAPNAPGKMNTPESAHAPGDVNAGEDVNAREGAPASANGTAPEAGPAAEGKVSQGAVAGAGAPGAPGPDATMSLRKPPTAPQPPAVPAAQPPAVPAAQPPAVPAVPPAPAAGQPVPPAPPTAPPRPPAFSPGAPAWGGPAQGQNPYAQQQPAPGTNPYAQQPGPGGANPYAQQPPAHPGGYPPQPGGPGQPGIPGQPFGAPIPGMPPAGGPGTPGGPGKKRTAVIIGAAAAVLLAAGGGAWAFMADSGSDGDKKPQAHSSSGAADQGRSGDDDAGSRPGSSDDDPNNARQKGEAKIVINQNGPEVARQGSDIPGFWVLDDYVVKTVLDKVVAYNLSDGKEKWTVPLPKRVCAAPLHMTDDGKVVVAYEGDKKDSCANYAMIDLKAGKKGWDKPIPKTGGFAESFIGLDMALSGNAVGAAWFGGSGMVRVSDGAQIPTPDLGSGCSVEGYAGGRALLRSWRCSTTDDTSHIEKVDPGTGKALWTYDGRKGLQTKKIYSTEPAVVSFASGDKKTGGVFALKDGKERSIIDLGKQRYAPTCGLSIVNSNLGGCQGVAASDDTLYLPTSDENSFRDGNEVHAFDLNTGKRLWASKNNKRELMPLRTEGKNVIAYQRPSFESAGAVVSVGPDGTPKVLLQAPQSTRSTESAFYSARYAYEGGRFFIASNRLTGTSNGDGGEKLLLAYGK